jgi:hypothetical protein
MKSIRELSKDELISLIYHLPPGDIDTFSQDVECAICGSGKSKYIYVCDSCDRSYEDENSED